MAAPPAPPRIPIEAIGAYPDRIDVRSPSEFAEDHVPGAANHPVLDDAERARVGTLHAQESAFAARRVGAALVSRNIAGLLENAFADRPRDWAPLVYCWRGGKRSGALAHILVEIGWKAVQLDGGYRSYRRHVVATLPQLPSRFRFRVVCGLTGSGKSRLLRALAAGGLQVLDLEHLARHRGSLLGDLPGDPQPSQKLFESLVLEALERFDPARTVYVESESRKIGTLQVPEALLDVMRRGECIRLDTPQALRLQLLKEEYPHFLADAPALSERLAHLAPLHGHKVVQRWTEAAAAGDWDTLVADLLLHHYDPSYTRAIGRNFVRVADAVVATPAGIADADFRRVAQELDPEARTPVPTQEASP